MEVFKSKKYTNFKVRVQCIKNMSKTRGSCFTWFHFLGLL